MNIIEHDIVGTQKALKAQASDASRQLTEVCSDIKDPNIKDVKI